MEYSFCLEMSDTNYPADDGDDGIGDWIFGIIAWTMFMGFVGLVLIVGGI